MTWMRSSFADSGKPSRILALVAALLALSVPAAAQNNANAPNGECVCRGTLGSPPAIGPRNFVFLIDGRRYDISTYRFFRSATVGSPQEELPSRAEVFFDSGMYRIIPEVEIEVGPGVGYAASIFTSSSPEAEGAASGFDTEIDFVDTEPPTVGDGLQVTTRVFENDCGAKALHFEDSGTSDDFSGNQYRLPVLVRIRSLERELDFTTFSTTYGLTGPGLENVIAYYPFTGWCIGERGLESLEFEFDEQVEFELTVYDYAGNAAQPRRQVLGWPIAKAAASGAGGAAGNPAGRGGTAGDPAGRAGTTAVGGDAMEVSNNGSGCSAAPSTDTGSCLGFFAFASGVVLWRQRRRPKAVEER